MKTELMFSAIAERYDFCNHLFSFGLDFHWRKKTARFCCNEPRENALDLCCGTGDLTFALADTGCVRTITGCDVSLPMLKYAKQKHNRRRTRSNGPSSVSIEWLCKPAENTGLADASFDLITCAFGLRNVDDMPRTLKEVYRLLKPGCQACILEFFLPQNRILRTTYLVYLCRMMPFMARWIAGASGPWHYLAESIGQWEKTDLREQLHQVGFSSITIHSLTFGAVQIITAQKENCTNRK